MHLYTLRGARLINALDSHGTVAKGVSRDYDHDSLIDSGIIKPRDCNIPVDALESYCFRYPRVSVRLSSPGAHSLHEATRSFELEEKRMLVCRTENHCLLASFSNAIALILGKEYVQKVVLCQELSVMLSFKDVAEWANSNAPRTVLSKVRIELGQWEQIEVEPTATLRCISFAITGHKF